MGLNIKNRYNRITFVISIFLCLLFYTCSLAQNIPPFHHISTAEGLPNNNIKWITTDEYGMAWIAAENGIARFDGTSVDVFKSGGIDSYGPAGGNVHYIGLVPGSHSVWIGATTGLSRYDQKTGNWSRIPILYNNELKAPLPTYIYPFHVDDKKVVWMYVGYYGSICKYYPLSGRLVPVTRFSNGKVYTPDTLFSELRYTVSALPSGIYFAKDYDENLNEKKLYGDNSNSEFFTNRCYYKTSTELWMATDQGLVRSNPHSGEYELFKFPSGITALCPDKLNPHHLWVGTGRHGVYRFNTSADTADLHIEHDPENQYSIRSNQITFLHADTLGKLYIGLAGKGMAYADFSHSFFSSVLGNLQSKKLDVNNSISHIFPLEDGAYLLGTTGSGLLRVTADNGHINSVRNIAGEQIYSGIKINDRYLLQSSQGFYFYDALDGNIEPLKPEKSLNLHVFNWVRLRNGLIYAGTDAGFLRVVTESGSIKFEGVPEVSEVLHYNYIQYVNYDTEDDLIYIKTNYTDFFVFKYTDGGFVNLKKLHNQNYLLNDLIPSPWNGRFLLAATSAGIKIWDKSALEWVEDKRNIFNQNIMSLSFHPYIGLWAATDNGLYRYSKNKKIFQRFDLRNGLSAEQFSSGKAILKRRMVLGSINGITMVPIAPKLSYVPQAKWVVKNAFAGKTKISAFNPTQFPDTLIVPENISDFSMDVTIQGVSENTGGHISYRLSGADYTWQNAENNAVSISYKRLSPGNYSLELFYYPNWPAKHVFIKNVTIIVKPAFYQTRWFFWTLVVINIGIVVGIVRLFILRQKRIAKQRMRVIMESQENERARIAADLHDDLGGKLSTLKLLLEETGRQKSELKDFNLYTGSMDMLDQSISDLRTALFNLNPRTLSESGFFSALIYLGKRIDSSGGLRIYIKIPDVIRNVRFSDETETVLYRVMQELMNNTIKHAKASKIEISFEIKNAQLIALYSDDGKGFDDSLVEKGLGLRNIRARVNLINGRVQFTSSVGRGVKVVIFIPVN